MPVNVRVPALLYVPGFMLTALCFPEGDADTKAFEFP